jgi:uncharacterized protein (DUF1697 family)
MHVKDFRQETPMSAIRYAAFLRAINVGGRNSVPMAGLKRLLETCGFSGVKTFIQSGNVVFGAPKTDRDALARKIGARLYKWLGYHVAVMVRPFAELEALVESNPFGGQAVEPETKMYVAFLGTNPDRKPRLPQVSDKEGLEVFAIKRRDVFILSRKVKGRFGFPNNFIEKELGVLATSRNWNTMIRMVRAEP